MILIDEIKNTFKSGTPLTKLIYINVTVFFLVHLFNTIAWLFTYTPYCTLSPWIAVPSSLESLLYRPWTLLTYMFLHEQFLHILFNMLWFFWFGKIFLMYIESRKLINIYLLGGISGAVLFILSYNIFPHFKIYEQDAYALGASASVLAVVVATATHVPNFVINLFLLGPVKIKYIAIFSIILDVLSIKSGNAGGHIAHLGGAIAGYFYIKNYHKGNEGSITKIWDAILSMFIEKKKMKVTYKKTKTDMEYNATKTKEQGEIDKVLEKISKSGYDSLTKREKELLFKMGK